MSCFWDAVLNKLKIEDFTKLNYSGKPGPKEFADSSAIIVCVHTSNLRSFHSTLPVPYN